MELPLLKLTQYGFFDSKISYANVTKTEERTAKEYEIEIFTEDCSGKAFLDDRIIKIKKNTIIVAKPGSKRHSLFPIKCLNIHLIALNKEAELIFEKIPSFFKTNNISEYEKTFNEIIATYYENPELYNLYINKQIIKILMLLINDSAANTQTPKIINNKNILLSVEKFLQDNFNQTITLNDMAEYANMSPTYFHKLFTAFFNKTPNEYLLNIRISHAKILLLNNKCNLVDIAFACGFSSQSYFCSKFKQITGKSPLAFRNDEITKIKF